MDGHSQTSKRDRKSSTKCRPKPIEAASFELAEDHSAVVSDNIGRDRTKSNYKSSEIVSTADVVYAVGQIWESTNRKLALLQPKRTAKPTYIGNEKENIVCQIQEKKNMSQSLLAENEQMLEQARVTKKSTPLESCSMEFWGKKKDVYISPSKLSNRKVCAAVGCSDDCRIKYGLTGHISLCTLRKNVPAIHEYEKAIKRFLLIDRSKDSGIFSCCKPTPSYDLRNCSSDLSSDMEKESTSGDSKDVVKNRKMSIPSLSSDYFLQVDGESQGEIAEFVASSSSSGNCAKNFANPTSSGRAYEYHQNRFDGDKDSELPIGKRNVVQCHELDISVEHDTETPSDKVSKYNHALAKQEHAFSGALAGTCVSLCLHPVDTLKTVIQSCRAEQKSLYLIGQSIISERGLTGLYRGIASNIATSAPISAIYTFSYETVKGHLLPFLPKEYHSFAHCTAGGCASVATSFIFTPSERIKQQMQVSPRYQNCWNALLRIIENGGLPSLYTGWGAVLCRNIPHSIIKFYTYESLKQHIFSSDQPKTWQTLLCGGLAGSTAAMFSTPFDVVKTRYQTQVPGSAKQYSGVMSAIQHIRKTEGVKGLYRGLTPRLVMYMSQGALFFTSYEFFKGLYCLERPLQSTL